MCQEEIRQPRHLTMERVGRLCGRRSTGPALRGSLGFELGLPSR